MLLCSERDVIHNTCYDRNSRVTICIYDSLIEGENNQPAQRRLRHRGQHRMRDIFLIETVGCTIVYIQWRIQPKKGRSPKGVPEGVKPLGPIFKKLCCVTCLSGI